MNLPKTLATLIVATSAFTAPAAFAATTSDPHEFGQHVKTIEVPIRGYDLTNLTDAKLVYAKIESAANRVCRLSSNRQTLRERVLRQACAEKATIKAVNSLDAPTVTAIMKETVNP